LLAPAIAGTKPLVCRYKGQLYFPALGYLNTKWENPVFFQDKFRRVYPENLKTKDPDSWAIWPLVYQDPYRRVRENEWPGMPGNPSGVKGSPSRFNWFGTDQSGRDVFAQMIHGTRIAMLVGFVSMGIAAVIGIAVGATAGYFGGWTDIVISRVIEVVMCIPTLVLILAIIAIIETTTIWHLMAVIGITSWTGIARLTRGEFLKLKQIDYTLAAQALGAGWFRIMFRHILRNALAPILVPITFGIASAIILESALSFLGFGAAPPNPSWGTLLNAGRTTIEQTWWLVLFPGVAIFLTVLAYNLIGEGLQEATDPRLREAGK
jgi:peptide/nickel transport system permease protein